MFNDERRIFEMVKQLKMEELQAAYDRLKAEEKDIRTQMRALEGKTVLTSQEQDCERKCLKREWESSGKTGPFHVLKYPLKKRLFDPQLRIDMKKYREAKADYKQLSKTYDVIQKRVDNAEIALERLQQRLYVVLSQISTVERNLIKIHQTKNLPGLLKITEMTQAEAVQYMQSKGIDERTI